ncbi:RIPOR family member 3 isoform X1 [Ochotona curzoniae]|uniref:RIPOR family member 3 isoform X1 n=1 Tax=Ochotona curzoniae TaxID=130825 RepID=UPI001B34AE2D|nr:RIPOR family member 3 isoform X1 [Ochotona curzoniae]
MSVRVRFLSPRDTAAVGAVGRSASFAGFSSAQSRRMAKGSSIRSSMRSRTPGRVPKAYATLRKGSSCVDPKPQQVKKIFEALKKGLKEYLFVQQAELDYLCGCHTDTHRSSRLAFYYDLDKQMRSVERHIRKMEFHISKVDELYEGYCIQCRLHDGACNMQRAFSRGPPSRASRESLQELGRSLHECTEDMWLIEGALEVHLGEFHVRMKGLVGYARLCPGDQYEVLMRLGRQRWKLKGRIESDDSQTWDEEEKAFIPTLHEDLEIKVTELRGLSSLTVGVVTCDIADFFCTRPQVIVVDITELGTIKLQLEVLWSPLDSESQLSSSSPLGKFSVNSRKGSLYAWTPPSTPSFRERYCLSVLQQPVPQPWSPGRPRVPSILSYLSDGDLHGRGPWSWSQELPEMDSFSSEDPRDAETIASASASDMGFLPLAIAPPASTEEQGPLLPQGLLPEVACLAGNSPVEPPGWRSLGEDSPDLAWGVLSHSGTNPRPNQEGQADGEAGDSMEGPGPALEQPLQEVLELLRAPHPTWWPQLWVLEHQVVHLRERLKPRGARRQEHASAESLTKCVLDSFAFLNAHFTPDQLSLAGDSQSPRRDRTSSPSPSPQGPSWELTAGAWELDELLAVHLRVCRAVLKKLLSPLVSRVVQERLLEEAVQQRRVLETLSGLDSDKVTQAAAAEAVCHQLLEQVVSCSGLLRGPGLLEEETLTWFQFLGYLQRHGVRDLEEHLAQLAKEVKLIEELHSSAQLKAIKKLQGKRLGQLQPLPQTLRAWALLQLDGSPRVCRAARVRLAGAARNASFREKALIFYTHTLAESDAKLQQAACVALQQLRGIESIDDIARLCQSDVEAVRTAAQEATLSFGEKGRLAFEKMDRLSADPEVSCQDDEVEITIF